jgi:hypothetical protein
MSFEISFRGRVKGPISSGKMIRDAANYSEDVAEALADSAKDTWLNNLHGSIRHQTPYYTTKIAKRQMSPTRYEIHDNGVLYGPWLESGEYTPRTRFTGYFSQERAEATVQAKRGNIARRILRRYRSQGKLI